MKRIGILGGTFNPVHSGHIALAKAALVQYDLDQVLFMTSGNPPHKKDLNLTPSVKRHEMVSLALEGEEKLRAFDYEVYKKTYSYTAQTLTELRELEPDWEIYFIIGEDSLKDIFKWYKPDVVLKNCILLVYPRFTDSNLDGLIKDVASELEGDIRPVNAPLYDISSTQIRKLVSDGKKIDEFVPEKVREYIIENGLYKK
jgi:nicotinate-nucleotide adenylyltransferase